MLKRSGNPVFAGRKGFVFGITLLISLSSFAQWVARYDGGNGDDYASAITVDDSGYVYVTGWSSGTYFDYTTIKYNSSGDIVWFRRYNGPGNDSAYAIAVDDSGYIYVTGVSYGSGTGKDYATIKYLCAGVEERKSQVTSYN